MTERLDSRKWTTGNNASVEMTYTLTGSSDDVEIRDAVIDNTPTTYNSLVRQSIQIEPVNVDSGADSGIWTAVVRYGIREAIEVGATSLFTFDTAGGVQHITQSLETIASYAAVGAPPDFQGAIAVTHDSVEGVDITVPVYNFSETHYLAASAVNQTYKNTLFALTGKVNNASFKGLAAGECLFLGASGSRRSPDDWEITYRFAGSPNRTGIAVGPITGIAKAGWQYLWVRYADADDADAVTIVKRPVAAYVERVYDAADFSLIGIGT